MSYRSANPFTPTFGRVPYALAGRAEFIDDIMEGLANQPGDPNRSTIFVGPRGSGKTVLLHTIAEEASQQGWVCVNVSARKDMLDRIVKLAHVHSGHLIGKPSDSHVTSVQVGPLAVEREISQENLPWWLDLQYLVEELNKQGVGLLVTIDEVDPGIEQLIDFIDTYQHFVAEGRDVALLMAGLPSKVSQLLLDKSVSFIRRAFRHTLGAIDYYEVEEALFETITEAGKSIEQNTLAFATKATKGFPFAIQLVGYYMWRLSHGRDVITLEDAQEAVRQADEGIISSIIVPTVQELTQREQEYLMAMAQDDGPSSTSEIAHRMGISMTNASNLRRRLREHGVIKDVRMGVVDFEMPSMRQYLRG